MRRGTDYTAHARSWQYRWEQAMVKDFLAYASEEGGASTWTQLHKEDIAWCLEQGAFLGGLFRGWEGREDGALLLYCREGAKAQAAQLLTEAGLSQEDPYYLIEED